MKTRANRCEYGHVNREKRRLLLGAVGMVVLALLVFLLGLALNKWEKRNIFSVLAVLFVLPWARYMSTLIVLLPFHTPSRKQYETVKEKLPRGAVLLSDYVFSTKEAVMGLSYLVLTGHELIGLTARPKEKKERIREALSELLKKRGIPGKVTILDKETEFLQVLARASETEKSKEEWEELMEVLRSLAI